jgi:hypothetical protein
MDTELYINSQLVQLAERPTFPFSFSISELTDLSKRSGASSKTITLPGTSINQAIFNSVFQFTSVANPSGQQSGLVDFDPTIKATAQVYQNGLLQFNGTAQLLSCKRNGGFWTFEITLVSEIIDYVAKMGEFKINELDYSEYDHVLTRVNVSDTWDGYNQIGGVTTSIRTASAWDGIGYYYGLIDYGFPRVNANTFGIEQFPLQVFCYGIMQKIFAKVGLTWQSNFLDSELFKRLAIAYQGGELPTVSPAQADTDSALNIEIASISGNILVGQQVGGVQQIDNNGTPEYVSSFGTATFADAIDIFVNQDIRSQMVGEVPALFRSAVRGLFNFHYFGRHVIDLDFDLGGATIVGVNATYTLRAVIYKNNAVFAIEDVYTGPITSTSLSQSFTIDFDYSRQMNLLINDEVRVSLRLVMAFTGIDLASFSGQNISYSVKVSSIDTLVNFEKVVAQIVPGSTVFLSALLPDMSAADFFNGFVKMFNLLVSPDKFEPTKLLIEPLIDYYKPSNEALIVTHKLDESEQVEVVPSANIASKRYQFLWQKDDDYFNVDYFNKFGEQFGSFELVNDSQLANSTTTYQLPFAQKLLANIPFDDGSFTGLVVPRNFTVSNGAVTPKKGKPFLVQVGRLEIGEFNVIDELGVTNTYTEYPFVGHLDALVAPTFDLNFGVPDVLYWNSATLPQVNLYQYHEQFLKELVSRYGRLVKCSMRWNEADIYSLDFRYLLNMDGVVYRLQKIQDYNPTNDNSTKTELLKYIL